MSDLISRKAAIDVLHGYFDGMLETDTWSPCDVYGLIEILPSAQPERLTDDDFETIRIHLNAFKENLCNQRRWKEAEEYQRIIDRFMSFASAQPRKGKWIDYSDEGFVECPFCHSATNCDGNKDELHYCFSCGAELR